MTPNALALVLLLTFLTVTIIDWLVALKSRAVVVLIALVIYFVWVIGVPVIATR